MSGRVISHVGRKFNKITVVRFSAGSQDKNATYDCVCDCGNSLQMTANSIRKELRKSCGCEKPVRASRAAKYG